MLRTFLIYFPTHFHFFLVYIPSVFLPVPTDCIRLNSETLETNEYRSVSSCIIQTSKKELFWKPTVIMKMGNNQTENETKFINEVVKQLIEIKIPYIALDTVENGSLDVSKANYMFVNYFSNCYTMVAFDFDALEHDIKYLFILESSEDCTKYFKGKKNLVAKYDVSVFVKDPNDDYILYTYVPYVNPETCKDVIGTPLRINSCFKGKLTSNIIFPSKITTNFKKCPFKVGMSFFYPLSIIRNKESLKTYDSLDIDKVKGMDVEMIKIMSDYFNATLHLYYIFKHEENPFINVEFLPFLLNGSLEACAGGVYRIYGDLVEYSGIYVSQTVTWIYYAERKYMYWENMAANIDGLYLFIIFYLSYSVAWYLICVFDTRVVSFKNTLLYSWGALVASSSLTDAMSFKQKVLNIVYLNMCLHLSVYISIQLYAFLTVQDPPEMFKTNEEIMNSGRTPYLNSLTKHFIEDEKYERFANSSIDCNGYQACTELSFLRNGITIVNSGYFYPYQAATAVNDEARMLRPVENLLTVYHEMIIRKESPLVLKFQQATVRLFEAGITEKLFKEAIGITIVGKANIATKNMMRSSYACKAGCKLSLDQFSGVFYVWGYGCAASFCLFILEVLIKR